MPPSSGYPQGYAFLYALMGLGAGLGLGWMFPQALSLSRALELLASVYGTLAPGVIYFILAPSLLKLVRRGEARSAWLPLQTLWWFARARLFACLLAIAVASLVYGLPWVGRKGTEGLSGLMPSIATLGQTMTESPYFLAIYAAAFTALLLRGRQGWLVEKFADIPERVESLGRLLTRLTPAFTFMMGLYVMSLPHALNETFQQAGGAFGSLTLFGTWSTDAGPSGIFQVYLAISLLTGALCLSWHLLLVFYVKARLPGFSIVRYLRDYLAHLYPLLWSTCSEAVSMPLNLYLLRKNYPQIQGFVRQFTISASSVLSTSGTLMCCFVLIPAVCALLELDISLVQLLLCLPVLYILGFGVPGIPGELVLFAGPVMGVLAVPPAQQALFVLTFIGLQIGLPDSFRTAANATEVCPAALLLNAGTPWREPQPTGVLAPSDHSPDKSG
jgi:Na+/H+-dicarboxylate symporter